MTLPYRSSVGAHTDRRRSPGHRGRTAQRTGSRPPLHPLMNPEVADLERLRSSAKDCSCPPPTGPTCGTWQVGTQAPRNGERLLVRPALVPYLFFKFGPRLGRDLETWTPTTAAKGMKPNRHGCANLPKGRILF